MKLRTLVTVFACPQLPSGCGVLVLIVLALACFPQHTPAVEDADIERLVELLNPAQGGDHIVNTNPFIGESASDIASAIKTGTWFSFLVFMPFLVLPQVLLAVIIFKFRAAKNAKPAATFTHNNRLELIWTAIPVLALLMVAVPISRLLYYQESPPEEVATRSAFAVEIIGRQFNWVYDYPDHDIRVSSYAIRDLPEIEVPEGANPPSRLNSVQESAVFRKGQATTLFITSADVQHAWWVPAFAVKKDAYPDRRTHTWFTPSRVGFYKGACAELCGADHGIMKIVATVLEPDDFTTWTRFKRHERAALQVVDAIRDSREAGETAFADYIAADARPQRLNALRFWMAYDAAIHTTLWRDTANRPFAGGINGLDEYLTLTEERKQLLRSFIDEYLESLPAANREGTNA